MSSASTSRRSLLISTFAVAMRRLGEAHPFAEAFAEATSIIDDPLISSSAITRGTAATIVNERRLKTATLNTGSSSTIHRLGRKFSAPLRIHTGGVLPSGRMRREGARESAGTCVSR